MLALLFSVFQFVLLTIWINPKGVGAEGVKGAIGKHPCRLRRDEIPCMIA